MEKTPALTLIAIGTLLLLDLMPAVDGNLALSRVRRSDDPNFLDLQSLVQQQAQVIQTLQSRLEAEETKLQSLTETVQNQQAATDSKFQALDSRLPNSFAHVAFTVHFSRSTDTSAHGIPLNPGQILQFDTIVTNVGNGYNPQTGIFTAPVSGLYTIFLTQMGTNAHGAIYLDIVKQGARLDEVYAEPHDQGSTQVTTHLGAGEQVWVRQVLGEAVRGGYWTIFTGYLVQAD